MVHEQSQLPFPFLQEIKESFYWYCCFTHQVSKMISKFSKLFYIRVKVYNDFPHHLFSSICWFWIWNMPKEAGVDIGISWNEEHWWLSFLTSCYDKIWWQKQLWRERGHYPTSQVQSILPWKTRWQKEGETAGDTQITSLIKNRNHRVHACVLSSFIFIRLRPAHEIVMPTFRVRS